MVYPKFLDYKKNIAIDKFETIANYLGLEKKPEAFVNKVIELLNITSLSESLENA